jgi:O-antigen/teichoic acid export membrane protein
MRLADYLKPGFWAGLDKALPVVYGVGFLFAVVRVLPKTEFGLLVLFQAVFLFIEMMDQALVQIPMAKFLSEGEQSGWAIPNSFLLSLVLLILAGLACLAGAPLLAALMNDPALASLLLYMPLLIAAFYLKNLTGQICVARHWIKRLFFIDATYFLGSLIVLIFWHAFGRLTDARQVIRINIYAAAASSVLAVILTWKTLSHIRWRLSLDQIKRLLTFGKYSFGAGVGNFFYAQIDTFLIGYFYAPIQVAVYAAGKIIFRFYNIVSQATQVVLLPLISRLDVTGQREELRTLAEKAICFLFLALLPFHLLFFAGSEVILDMIYHGKYNNAAPILRWLVLGAIFLPWGTVGSNVQLGMGQPKVSFLFVGLVAVFNIFANLLLLPAIGLSGAAVATALTMMFGAVLQTLYMRRAIRLRWRGIWQRRLDALNFGRMYWTKLKWIK